MVGSGIPMQRTPTPPGGATSDLLAERYGRAPRRSRFAGLAAVAVVAVAGLAWVVWAAANSPAAVSGQLQGLQVESGSQVTVTVTVFRRNGDAVRCQVYAQAADRTIVGESTFDIPPGEPGTVTVDHGITTERPAISGALRTCEVAPAAE